jgi:DNA polymerase III subunit epsilon
MQQFERLTFIDFETTQSPTGLRAVEVGAVLFEHGQEVQALGELINPGCRIDHWSMSIHHISNEDVTSASDFLGVWQRLRPLLEEAVVVAHNAGFDAGALRNELVRHSLTPPPLEWWDTLRLARRVWRRMFQSYSLDHLRCQLMLPGTVAHRALDDARVASHLFATAVADAAQAGEGDVQHIRAMARLRSPKSWPWESPFAPEETHRRH